MGAAHLLSCSHRSCLVSSCWMPQKFAKVGFIPSNWVDVDLNQTRSSSTWISPETLALIFTETQFFPGWNSTDFIQCSTSDLKLQCKKQWMEGVQKYMLHLATSPQEAHMISLHQRCAARIHSRPNPFLNSYPKELAAPRSVFTQMIPSYTWPLHNLQRPHFIVASLPLKSHFMASNYTLTTVKQSVLFSVKDLIWCFPNPKSIPSFLQKTCASGWIHLWLSSPTSISSKRQFLYKASFTHETRRTLVKMTAISIFYYDSNDLAMSPNLPSNH